jgi:hypothetical protein
MRRHGDIQFCVSGSGPIRKSWVSQALETRFEKKKQYNLNKLELQRSTWSAAGPLFVQFSILNKL